MLRRRVRCSGSIETTAGNGDDGWTVRVGFPLRTGACITLSTMLPGKLWNKQEDT